MLNIGQVVYDYTNKRVVIFAGMEMLQNEKTGKCHSESSFILKDGTFIYLKGEKDPFEYANLNMGGKPFIGQFVTKARCGGCYFGIIDGNNVEVKVWAKETIEETEELITKHGLNVYKKTFCGKPYNSYHIGKSKESESKNAII